MNIHKVIRGKTLGRWKLSAEEDYNKTPISVLKYITVLEDELASNTDIIDHVSDCSYEVWNVTNNSLIKSCKYKETAEVYMNVLASLESKYEIRKISCR